MELDGSDLILVREAHNGSNFYYGSFRLQIVAFGGKPSYRHHFGGTRTGPTRSNEDDIDCSQGRS